MTLKVLSQQWLPMSPTPDSGLGILIDQIDNELIGWAQSHDADAVLSPPMEASDRRVICMHLLRLLNEPTPRTTTRELKLQLVSQYLVTTSGPDPADSHRLLWEVIVSAVARSRVDGWRISFDPLSDAVWTSFQLPPQPCFVIGIPVSHEWDQPDLPQVMQPPELESSPCVSLKGIVVGPERVPIAGARVEVPSLKLATVTDSAGRYSFSSIPSGQHYPTELIVRAKRHEQTVKMNSGQRGKPLIIELKLKKA